MTSRSLGNRLQAGCAAIALTALLGAAPADDAALYKSRIDAMLAGREAPYAPLETVPGAARPLAVATPGQRSVDAAALDAATAYAAANNSAAFIVWRDGRIQAQAYFGANTAATLLKSKSLSKPLSAIAIGRAIALGKVKSLDQPVADFIPEWRGGPKAAILVRHLLDMRSGLLEQSFTPDPESPLNRAYFDPDHGKYLIDSYPLTDPPGTKFNYSNASAELVAVLIERATGRRYAEFIGNEILKPIGAPGGQIWVDRPGGLAHSGCCLMAPAETWLRLAIMLLDDGVAGGRRLLPKGFVTAMQMATPENPHYGLALWVAGPYFERRGFSGNGSGPQVLHSAPYRDGSLYLFDGNHNQTVYISPATGLVIVRLGAMPPAKPEWDNSYLPNLLIGAAKPLPGKPALVPQR